MRIISPTPSYDVQAVLVQVLMQEKSQELLEKILTWQKLDILDVDGACILYKKLVEMIL
ncbi:MAG: hypothetical protein SGARI_007444, partial [Bacillariaceae sp.]